MPFTVIQSSYTLILSKMKLLKIVFNRQSCAKFVVQKCIFIIFGNRYFIFVFRVLIIIIWTCRLIIYTCLPWSFAVSCHVNRLQFLRVFFCEFCTKIKLMKKFACISSLVWYDRHFLSLFGVLSLLMTVCVTIFVWNYYYGLYDFIVIVNERMDYWSWTHLTKVQELNFVS